MEFVKQRVSLPIRNIEGAIKKNVPRKHGILLPTSIRCLICGPSNCGKTNILISLLENPNGLRFQNVYIFSKTLDQEKYKYLEEILRPIKSIGFHTFSSNDKVIPPENVKPNSIMIFDDVICDKQDNIKAYFSMGRHRGVDSFFLAQTYTRISKHLIRDNANLVVLFRQDETNLRHVYSDFAIGTDMSFDQFRQICNKCWKDKYGFIVIDMDSDPSAGKYRKGFDCFLQL